MHQLIKCVPNFSEGRDKAKIKLIEDSIKKVKGILFLNSESDIDHNRTVITFAGEPIKVIEAAFNAIKTAAKIIDLNVHKGVHPRIGATDVVPLIPLKGITIKETVKYSIALAKRVGEKVKIPVYLYENSAIRKDRKNLALIRKGQYERLKKEITLPEKTPDFGLQKMGPAGATVIGVRGILVAYNINLKTSDVEIAKIIANAVREKAKNGLKNIKALGLYLKSRDTAQVSMNLTDYKKTPPLKVFKKVETLAKKLKTKILESEIIGLIPSSALPKNIKILKIKNFSDKKILEKQLKTNSI
ncbi:glutamate formimidoyltransferase [Candidatus Peregrinibacteria bacterium CG_4_10_14_0_2_um_filter_38_24]|nr:MAG: glutamate formimidoyltransferase [Candidatus Peregrinibacteria bacterium CG_4_10_14_0_2_um_filter_38_24]